MAVITVSRQFGSGGDEIVEKVCKTTGYYLFDKQLLAKAAFEAGLSDQEIVDYSEDNYRVKNFLDRLFGRSRPVAQVRVWKEGRDGVRTMEEMNLSEENALSLVRNAIETSYKMGNIVIVGRGGQMILKDHPDVLHVRIEAPLEERLLRVRSNPAFASRSFSDSFEARQAAQNLIEVNDIASADYLKRFYGVDWSDPMLYHMVINTCKLSIEQSARLIIDAAQRL
jgi:cytidylate kinase